MGNTEVSKNDQGHVHISHNKSIYGHDNVDNYVIKRLVDNIIIMTGLVERIFKLVVVWCLV